MPYILVLPGTIGKTIAHLQILLSEHYHRKPPPMVSFDSDGTNLITLPISTENHHIKLRIDGIDVADAMKGGKYNAFSFISQSLLKTYSEGSAMGLLPFMGKLLSTVHKPKIRNPIANLVKLGSDEGEITVIRAFSSFGGTSRGVADEINETLWDISRGSGLRIKIMDIVFIPGLSTASSSFHKVYQRNTYAYIKEISALRTGRFHRIMANDSGNMGNERHEFPSHSLVLVNDTHENGVFSLDDLIPSVTRFIELLTRAEVSPIFQGVVADLERHETNTPYADRLGLFSLYIPNKEKAILGQMKMTIDVLNRLVEVKGDHPALARRLLADMGFYAKEAEQLGVWKAIKNAIIRGLNIDPIASFQEIYLDQADEYFTHYEELRESIYGLDTEAMGYMLFDEIMSQEFFDDRVNSFKDKLMPGDIPSVLNNAIAILDYDHKELERSVLSEDAGILSNIGEYENSANQALEYFASAKRWKKKDALMQVKRHLLSAMELCIKVNSLKVFHTMQGRLLEAIGTGEIRAWKELEQQARDMSHILKSLRDEQVSVHDSLKGDRNIYRGNSRKLQALKNAVRDMDNDVKESLITSAHNIVCGVYGQSSETVKRAVMMFLAERTKLLSQSEDAPLTSRSIAQHDYDSALKAATPFLMIDTTANTYRRALFCFSPLRDSREMIEKAFVNTGVHVDREKYISLNGVDDEMTLMTYDKGVPLSSIKAVMDCRKQYYSDTERYKGHLDPLNQLLPDPVGALDAKRHLLAGLITGCVKKAEDGYVYTDLEGADHTVRDISFFSDYSCAVELASKLIAMLKRNGFDPVLRQVEHAISIKEFEDTAPEMLAEIKALSSIYEGGVS